MERTNKYYSIIENLVKQHKKYPGNEAILDDIIDDVYSHAEVIINSINNDGVIIAYLEKVVSTSIITVPKRMGFHKEIPHRVISPLPTSETRKIDVNKELVDKMINSPSPDKAEEKKSDKQVAAIKQDQKLTDLLLVKEDILEFDDDIDSDEQEEPLEFEDNIVDEQSNLLEDNFVQEVQDDLSEPADIILAEESDILDNNFVPEQPEDSEEQVDTLDEGKNDILEFADDINSDEQEEPLELEDNIVDKQSDSLEENIALEPHDDTVEPVELLVEESADMSDDNFVQEQQDDLPETTETLVVEETDALSDNLVPVQSEALEEQVDTLDEGKNDILELADDINSDEQEKPLEFEESIIDEQNDILEENSAQELQEDLTEHAETLLVEEPDILNNNLVSEQSEVLEEPALAEEHDDARGLVSEDELIPEQQGELVEYGNIDTLVDNGDGQLEPLGLDDTPLALADSDGADFTDLGETLDLDNNDLSFNIEGQNNTQETLPIEDLSFEQISEETNVQEEEHPQFVQTDYSKFSYTPNDISDDIDTDRLVKELEELNTKRPELNIFKVYNLKYKDNCSVSQIASQLNMNEDDIVEALSEMVAII